MSRQRKRASRRGRGQEDFVGKLIVFGLALSIGPLFFGPSPIKRSLAFAMPVGLLMVVSGVVLLWLSRRKAADAAQPSAKQPLEALSERTRASDQAVARNMPDARPTAQNSLSLERTRPTSWSRAVFDVIEWRRFEALVEALFQQAGFQTTSQSHGADGGVDIWLYSRNQPGEPVSLVQCKHWQGKRVGVDKIRELCGVMAARKVRRGQFATTTTFTPDAEAFARENAINLLDVERLLALITARTPLQQQALLDVALEGEYWRPTCVNCGDKMVERVPRAGGASFWGCPAFPRCRTTLPMKGVA